MIVTYEAAKHYDMIASWRPRMPRPEYVGSGLVVADVCAGFVGVVGGTHMAFFYGLVSNPRAEVMARGRWVKALTRQLRDEAKAAGLHYGVFTSRKPGVQRIGLEFSRDGGSRDYRLWEGPL